MTLDASADKPHRRAGTVYTHGHGGAVLRSHGWRTAANSAAYLLPYLTPGTTVLDVGCGPGTITQDFAALVAPGRVLGIDPADVATSSLPNLTFSAGDVYALGDATLGDATLGDANLGDVTYDVVHAHQVLQHLSDPVAALREMLRVCTPNGVVGVRDADYDAMCWYPLDERLSNWQSIYRQVARANGGEPDAGRRLVSWARAAGASSVEPTASVWCFATPADREWWSSTWADRISTGPLADRAVDLGIATHAELLECADGWRAWGEHPDGWFSVVHAEVVARP